MWCMLFFPSSEWWKIIPGLECCSFISSAVVPFHRHHCNSRSHVIFCLSPSIIYPGTESCWSPNEWLFTCDTCPLLLLSNFTAWISRLLHLPLRRLRPTWRGWGPGARCRTPRSPEKQLSVLMLSTRNVLKKLILINSKTKFYLWPAFFDVVVQPEWHFPVEKTKADAVSLTMDETVMRLGPTPHL